MPLEEEKSYKTRLQAGVCKCCIKASLIDVEVYTKSTDGS